MKIKKKNKKKIGGGGGSGQGGGSGWGGGQGGWERRIEAFVKIQKKRGECRCRGLDLTQKHLKMEKKTKKEENKSAAGKHDTPSRKINSL